MISDVDDMLILDEGNFRDIKLRENVVELCVD